MPSKNEFLRHSQVKAVILRNKENNTPAKCISANEPTLGKLVRTYGDEFSEKYICVWLIELQELIGVKNKMNDFQIEMCAQMILEEFKQINLADMQCVSKRVISGHYGQFYESISIPKVIEIFRSYFNERCETASMWNHQIKTSGQIEREANDSIKALMEIGVVKPDELVKMGKSEAEFQKFNAEYHRQKLAKQNMNAHNAC